MRGPGLRLIRLGEGLYAAVAILLWTGMPFPPHGAERAASINLFATALVALVLAWRARAASRRLWLVAATLAAWVLTLALLRSGVVLALLDQLDSRTIASLMLASLLWVAQVIVVVGFGVRAPPWRGAVQAPISRLPSEAPQP